MTSVTFAFIDWLLIALYFLALILLSWKTDLFRQDEEQYLLSGRRLTLPAFVASLVATWYGGILGVGEYSFQFGISQWLVLGFPYYIFSILFAYLLAGRIRRNKAMSMPEAIAGRYGRRAGQLSALPIFVLVSPAPYILMIGLLIQFMTGWSGHYLWFSLAVALLSSLYVGIGGFGAVIRTHQLQFLLMFIGFILLISFAMADFGSIPTLWKAVPDHFRSLTGGHSVQYILVWFFIALWTFVDPGFHQRVAAAESPRTARRGILVSILFWALFDFLTTFSGMYAWGILGGDFPEPILAYPALAEALLPAGIKGLFFVSLLATILSTLDGYLFLAGQTLGRDLLAPSLPRLDPTRLTRWGILAAAMIGLALISLYPSVIEMWYVLGSVFIPGLLIPVVGVYLRPFRLRRPWFFITLAGSSLVSLFWLVMGSLHRSEAYAYAWHGVEPFYPGLLASFLFWYIGRERRFEEANQEPAQTRMQM